MLLVNSGGGSRMVVMGEYIEAGKKVFIYNIHNDQVIGETLWGMLMYFMST